MAKLTGNILSGRGFRANIDNLLEEVADIAEQSARLNQQITRNPFHPQNLGLDGRVPSFLAQAERDLRQTLLTGHPTPTTEQSARLVKKLADNPQEVERVFWREVGKYYGVTIQQARRLGLQGLLRSPVSQRSGNRRGYSDENDANQPARYERYVEWIRRNIPHVNNRILNASQQELNELAQHYAATGRTSQYYYQPFSRDEREEWDTLYSESHAKGGK